MNKSDHLLRQKLNAHESTFSEAVLEGVLLNINAEKDKRKYPIWFWVGCALLILIVVSSLIPSLLNSKKAIVTHPSSIEEDLLVENKSEFISTQEVGNNNLSSMTAILIDSTNQESSSQIVTGINQNLEGVEKQELFQNEKPAPQLIPEPIVIIQKNIIELEPNTSNKVELVERSQLRLNQLPIVFNLVKTQTPKQALREPIGCPTFNDKGRKPIFIEAYISHDMPFRSLSSNTAESQADYIGRRNDSESATYSFHTGIRASGSLVSNFVMRVGLDYAQITEKFKVTALETTREVIIRDADGNIISTTTEQGTRDIVKYNKFKSYNIPVSIGWHSQLGKLNLAIHGGAAISMVSSHNGVILEPGTMPAMARIVSSGSDGELAAFKNDLGLSAIGSVGIAYPIKEKLDFVIEPNIKYILNPINLTTFPVEQRMFTVGLLTGVRYKF